MTLGEAITRYNRTEDGVLSEDEIIACISSLDGRVFNSVIHPVTPGGAFTPYGSLTDLTTALLIPFPYDECYLSCITAKNALTEGNTERYRVFAALTNSLLAEFRQHYLCTHIPPRVGIKAVGE